MYEYFVLHFLVTYLLPYIVTIEYHTDKITIEYRFIRNTYNNIR